MLESSIQVSIISLLILTFFSYVFRKKILTGWVYIVMLYFMFIPGIFFPVKEYIGFFNDVSFLNLIIFIFLLFLGFIPWLIFDSWLKKIKFIYLSNKGISVLNVLIPIIIIFSFFSIIYVFPYSLQSLLLGASEIRGIISDESVLPPTVLTTFSVAIAACFPLFVLLFYFSIIDKRLKKYRFFLLISSSVYIFTSMAFTARDGLVILPILYIIFYLIFKKTFSITDIKFLKKTLSVIFVISFLFLINYSVDRFYNTNSYQTSKTQNFVNGTFGYIFQQPYVFDKTLQYQDNFHGFNLRFPILNKIFFIPDKKIERINDFETMFGTMYADFFSINGYVSLFIFALSFSFFYAIALKYLIRSNRITGIFFLFTIYLYIVISGLFYFRIGNMSFNYLFAFLSLLPFFMKNIVRVKFK
ncbi:MAG: O-antigen polymerase [Paludibacter sp.]|nr:O-antigen polymerase [Paludibacter sp.]